MDAEKELARKRIRELKEEIGERYEEIFALAEKHDLYTHKADSKESVE